MIKHIMEHYTTIREITPLSDKDCLYIVERKKNEFTYPLHTHGAYELNFIRNGKGIRRLVGDHISEIDDLELVLIAGADLEYTWEQGNCPVHDMYEITIQFTPDLFPVALLNKNQYATIRTMLERAQCGVSFSQNVIISVYGLLEDMSSKGSQISGMRSRSLPRLVSRCPQRAGMRFPPN